MTRQALLTTAAVVVEILFFWLVGKWVFYPGSTQVPEVALRQEEPRAQSEEPAKSPETDQD